LLPTDYVLCLYSTGFILKKINTIMNINFNSIISDFLLTMKIRFMNKTKSY
jgi:hypothetical protein